MEQRKTYQQPTVKVVELNTRVALLESSVTLTGYQYQPNTIGDGWSD
ncbi:MAG: hypothetical protein J6O54_03850 [Prevotella sp.]|nr:hypothetical protein [Prevotella sp.]